MRSKVKEMATRCCGEALLSINGLVVCSSSSSSSRRWRRVTPRLACAGLCLLLPLLLLLLVTLRLLVAEVSVSVRLRGQYAAFVLLHHRHHRRSTDGSPTAAERLLGGLLPDDPVSSMWGDEEEEEPPLDTNALARAHAAARQRKRQGDFGPGSIKYGLGGLFDAVMAQPGGKYSNERQQQQQQQHRFTLSPAVAECGSRRPLLLLALVIVGPALAHRRQLIRETWARRESGEREEELMRVVFVVGKARSELVNGQVREEHARHHDILQLDFIDSYTKITLKVLEALRWTRERCGSARYILRINDHLQVDRRALIAHFGRGGPAAGSNNSVWGMVLEEGRVVREWWSKYMVARRYYGHHTYLPYVEGSAWVMSGEVAARVHAASRHVRWPRFSLSLEDIYVGMLCLHLDVNFRNITHRIAVHHETPKSSSVLQSPLFVFTHSIEEFKAAWARIQQHSYART